MQEIKQIGNINWSYNEIKTSIPSFLELYKKRPIEDNHGGMMAPHMFALWFMLKKLNPKIVIESGVWKGQGTWLIENTLPNANVVSIDINLSIRKYISRKAKYYNKDFNKIDWSFINDKNDTVVFFDDHQNAFERVKQAKKMGFINLIFEDNYPKEKGDCYSLKKAFQHAGFMPPKPSLKQRIFRVIKPTKTIQPNIEDAHYLKNVLDIYYEFPPVFKKEKTRWDDDWNENTYPTPLPLYTSIEHDALKIFDKEAVFYTWICYAKVKK